MRKGLEREPGGNLLETTIPPMIAAMTIAENPTITPRTTRRPMGAEGNVWLTVATGGWSKRSGVERAGIKHRLGLGFTAEDDEKV